MIRSVLRAWSGDVAERYSPRNMRALHSWRGGNHASLWDAMRGRSLFYSPNLLKTIYLNKRIGVPSGIRTRVVAVKGRCPRPG